MNEDLSEDLTSWPSDPYELLGVQFGDSSRTVRLAYTRLIRRFKPEKFPEQFRRLREAYELIQSHIEWSGDRQVPDHTDPPRPSPTSTARHDSPRPSPSKELQSDPTDLSPNNEQQPGPPGPNLQPSLQSGVDQAWRVAQEGDMPAAYTRLQSLKRKFGPNFDIAVREYWLLKLAPALDALRTRFDPLLEMLSMDPGISWAIIVWTRELEQSPKEGISDRFSQQLQNMQTVSSLADLLQLRWQSAGRLRRPEIIIDDIDRFRETVSGDDEAAWCRLLLSASDQLAWFDDERAQACLKSLLEEVRQLSNIHIDLTYEIDRLDLLLMVTSGWRKLRAEVLLDPDLARLIQASWLYPFPKYQRLCAEQINRLAAVPSATLKELDRVYSIEASLVFQLENAIRNNVVYRPWSSDEEAPDEHSKQLVTSFLHTLVGTQYVLATRERILAFCIQEAVSPNAVAEAAMEANSFEAPDGRDLGACLNSDAALRCTYSAWQALWA